MMVQSHEGAPLDGVSFAIEGTTLHLRGNGKLCLMTLGSFSRSVSALLDANPIESIHFDLSRTSYLDSTILGNLVGLHKRMKGGLRIHCPSPDALQALQVMGLNHLLFITEDADVFQTELSDLDKDKKTDTEELLDAHSLLSELSPENARRFAGLQAILRDKLKYRDR